MENYKKQNNTPLVSIIIPVYNRLKLCEEAIESSLNQQYDNIEIIVGDNCSTDGTFEYIKNKYANHEKVVVFQNDKNLGPVGNWEKCIEKCSGKYIKILWSDDLMEPSFISKCVSVMENDDTISFAYSSVCFFYEANDLDEIKKLKKAYVLRKCGRKSSDSFIKSSFMIPYSVPVSPGCALFRTEKLRIDYEISNHINYTNRMNGAGIDLFIFFNALSPKCNFYYFNEPLNYFRVHNGSISIADDNIMIGYYTAKINFLENHPELMKYKKYLTNEIISEKYYKNPFKKNNIFSKRGDILKYLNWLYDSEDATFCFIDVFIYELRKKLNLLFNI